MFQRTFCPALAFTALAFTISFCLLTSAPAAVADGNLCWKVSAKHYFLGHWNLLVTPDAIKADDLNNDYTIVSYAPKWNITAYSDKKKLRWEMTNYVFMEKGLPITNSYVTEFDLRGVTKTPAIYKNFKAEKLVKQRGGGKSKPRWALSKLPDENDVRLSRYYLTDAISLPPKLNALIQRLFSLPQVNGFPLAFIDVDDTGKENAVFDVTDTKKVPGAKTKIEVPKQYKMARDMREITVSTSQKEDLEEFMK